MRRALLVGIDDYGPGVPPLGGCVGDAWRMFQSLSTNEDGSQNFECLLVANPGTRYAADLEQARDENPDSIIISESITASSINQQLHELFSEKADVALFYFAGHGTVNNLGGYLVTKDFEHFNPGVSMPELITLANNAKADEVVIIIDCCHSGKIGEVPALGNENAILREGVSILTATSATQPALEEYGGGLFTSVICEALNGVATDFLGRITVASLYTYVEQAFGAWKQRPLYKSNVRRMVTLRTASPPLSFEILRNITKYFPVSKAKYDLDPSFEPSDVNSTPQNQEIFADLQAMRSKGLVEPIGEEHMYYAAMNSQSCQLTALGRYYWRLGKMKKFGVSVSK